MIACAGGGIRSILWLSNPFVIPSIVGCFKEERRLFVLAHAAVREQQGAICLLVWRFVQ